MVITTRVIISGIVQCVGYRAFCKQQAQRLGITGWVKNRSDGSVEAELSGTKDRIETLMLCLYDGPPLSHVESITQTAIVPPQTHTSFTVLQ